MTCRCSHDAALHTAGTDGRKCAVTACGCRRYRPRLRDRITGPLVPADHPWAEPSVLDLRDFARRGSR